MTDPASILVTLGSLLLIGLLTDLIGRRTALPRVTLLLGFGLLIGPSVLNLLPDLGDWFAIVADMALVMVGFLLGETLSLKSLRRRGHAVLAFSLAVALATIVVEVVGLILLGLRVEVALLLAGIAAATDPAATADVVHELRGEDDFSRTLLGIVAVDDAWGLIVFSLLLAMASAITGGDDVDPWEALLTGAWDLGGAALLGVAVGVPTALLTGRIRKGEPTLSEALGVVFLCGGLALWLEVSFLLAAMVLGAVVANLARHHERPFHAIEDVEWPFMIVFFVLAGASLRLESLHQIGALGVAYMVLRVLGRLIGAWVGGLPAGVPVVDRLWMGLSLLPQAGVALGMALVASQRFPEVGRAILPVVIAATVLFELIGPILTRLALTRARGATRKVLP
jgi:Kef-type K+ transport system membrane component KefB